MRNAVPAVAYERWTLSSFGGRVALRMLAWLEACPRQSAEPVANARSFADAAATPAAIESNVRAAAATASGSPAIGASWLEGTTRR